MGMSQNDPRMIIGIFDDVLTAKELTDVLLSFLTRRYDNIFFLYKEHTSGGLRLWAPTRSSQNLAGQA